MNGALAMPGRFCIERMASPPVPGILVISRRVISRLVTSLGGRLARTTVS